MGSSEMKKYEYKVLSFYTSNNLEVEMELKIESFGDKGYELINNNVVGHKIYVFLMREKL